MKYLPWLLGVLFGVHIASYAATPSESHQIPAPVLHYAFQRHAVGERIHDTSGMRNDGLFAGNLQMVDGIGGKGKALRLDGRADCIRVPRSASLEPDAVTVAVWIRTGAGTNADEPGAIVFKRNTSYHDNEDYCLELFPDHTLHANFSSPHGGHRFAISSVALAPDLWHHVAMVLGPQGAWLYVDGVPVGGNAVPCTLDHCSGADLLIGFRDHAALSLSRYGEFDLADVRIWPEALDGNQIAALYREKARFPGVARPECNVPPAVPSSRTVGPSRIFPAWQNPSPDGAKILAELRELVLQGRRDRAASPEYLDALQRLIERHSADGYRGPDTGR